MLIHRKIDNRTLLHIALYGTHCTMLLSSGFSVVRTAAATGRHLTVVALKSGVSDVRPSSEVREKSDSHLNTLEKQAPKRGKVALK